MDYEKLGLKCGLEIHQQLNTAKLFCNCPSQIRDDKPHFTVTRRLRAAAGETGKIDAAALSEMRKDVYYVYEYYKDTNCLVELDEEPPHNVNKDAVEIVLKASALFKSQVLDTAQFMRKTVVDGSNTSGFQRTALMALGGIVPTSLGDVRLESVCLEEDSAKIIERTGDFTRYNLSKLGIPLIEVATAPDIKTPEHAKETAAYIGMVLRSTKGVKRGLGTIRQDLNVSIAEGERIEIKGAQDLKLVPLWVENEAKRQIALVEIKKSLPATLDFPLNITDVTDLVKNCDNRIIQKVLKSGGKVKGFKVDGFAGLLGKELQPGRRLGSELSDYAKVAAGVGGIIHSDEDITKYSMDEKIRGELVSALSCGTNDAFILVCADESKCDRALAAAHERALRCTEGVIKEVRKPKDDGTSSYMRPIPGAARMYPETDSTPARLRDITVEVPQLLDDQKKEFASKYKLPSEKVDALFSDSWEELFADLVAACKNLKPSFISETLLSTESELSKQKIDASKINDVHYHEILLALDGGKISKQSLMQAFTDVAKTGTFAVEKYKTMDEETVRAEIAKIAKANEGAPFNVLMGKVMGVLRGKADGALVSKIVKEFA